MISRVEVINRGYEPVYVSFNRVGVRVIRSGRRQPGQLASVDTYKNLQVKNILRTNSMDVQAQDSLTQFAHSHINPDQQNPPSNPVIRSVTFLKDPPAPPNPLAYSYPNTRIPARYITNVDKPITISAQEARDSLAEFTGMMRKNNVQSGRVRGAMANRDYPWDVPSPSSGTYAHQTKFSDRLIKMSLRDLQHLKQTFATSGTLDPLNG